MKLWLAIQLLTLRLSGASLAGAEQARLGAPEAEIPVARSKPNIVFIITDDQDLHLRSLDYLPYVKKHLIDQGLFYKRHYCTTALCCPSRVSLWTGKQAHNTNVTDVNPPYGGYPKFVKQGFNEAYLPVWLQNAGYNTYYTGKLFNAHTVENYNAPHVRGWTGSDFLLDPFTYMYLNATYQRNKDAPVSYEGQHSVDVLAEKALGFLDEAAEEDRPFFLAIAPVAPHSNVEIKNAGPNLNDVFDAEFTAPIPLKRHEHLFKDVKVPRTDNFNPDSPSGANWVRRLPQQSQENVDYNDHFYRQRLRTLQGVDELVDGVFQKLEEHDLLDNTYIFYTTDNGYHIGQHRLQPGKECGFEEDINIPLIVRGPGVPAGEVADVVTTHIDLAPTILDLVGAPIRADFDGDAIPLSKKGLQEAAKFRHEHVTVEYWGFAAAEGDYFDGSRITINNTYKALRIISKTYNFYYSVWCNNEHELYDLRTDPQQLKNLLHADEKAPENVLGLPLTKVVARLDSLLFVLKSCKGQTCVRPWQALHPAGNVQNLHDALAARFDDFYETQQKKVRYDRCELGQILDAEGPQFERDGLVYRHNARWDNWV
ncbi:arylsulfatase-like protein [Coniochaeta ligniaria NRRL 30616]|uniref:Arylsulfatase n=1 Tax=Coniochaeta ligniaria NRRL 30616 TaxID=1408157 RepID=A0A1J7J0K4_9PEZI|nr:arylsulfatase-like protein [Coniochaeta ligniaria NRRL 30616]